MKLAHNILDSAKLIDSAFNILSLPDIYSSKSVNDAADHLEWGVREDPPEEELRQAIIKFFRTKASE